MTRFGTEMAASIRTRSSSYVYAMKANSSDEVRAVVESVGIGFEFMTPDQYSRLEDTKRSILSGFSKRSMFEDPATVSCRFFIVEAPHDVSLLRAVPRSCASRALLRLQLSDEAKLGLPMDVLRDCLSLWPESCAGFHFHLGWNVSDSGAVSRAIELTNAAVELWSACRPGIPCVVNVGGSFAEPKVDERQLADRLRSYDELLNPTVTEIICEPGRYVVGDAGMLDVCILDVDPQRRRIAINSCAYGYKLTGATPAVILPEAEGTDLAEWTIDGMWPAESDRLERVLLKGTPRRGGTLRFGNMGAYVEGIESQFDLRGAMRVKYVTGMSHVE